MKLITIISIFIRLTKYTVESSQLYETWNNYSTNTANEYSIVEDHSSDDSPIIKNVFWPSCQIDLIPAPLHNRNQTKETTTHLEKDKAKPVEEVLPESVSNVFEEIESKKNSSKKAPENSNSSFPNNTIKEHLYAKIKLLQYLQQALLANTNNLCNPSEGYKNRDTTPMQKRKYSSIFSNSDLESTETNSIAKKLAISENNLQHTIKKIKKNNPSNPDIYSNADIERSPTSFNDFLETWKMNNLDDESGSTHKNRINTNSWNKMLNKEKIQNNLKSRIDELHNFINSHKNLENIWKVVKKLTTDHKNMYTNFCIIYMHRKAFKIQQKQFVGYYDGFFKDLANYMKEHMPRTGTEQKDEKKKNGCIQKYTLGDIYMKQELTSDSIKTRKNSSVKKYDSESLEDRVQAILKIREIYKDLTSMPLKLFEETLLESARSSEDSFTPMQVGVLDYLYKILHCKRSDCRENGICVCNKYLTPLKNVIESSGRKANSYTTEELYKEVYKTMVLFYRLVRYFYKDANTGERIEIMGKDVVVEQVCIKCEAIIVKHGNALSSPYRIVPPVTYTSMSHHWNTSIHISPHYHIQFVDNSLHTLKRVCLPFFKTAPSGYSIQIHKITDIIEYLERIYNIKETGKIYPLAVENNSSTWRVLRNVEKTYSINYLKKKKKLFSVIFYYIKKGLENKPFTLSMFKNQTARKKTHNRSPYFCPLLWSLQ